MFYLYGKHISNLNWELIGRFSTEEAETYMDLNEYGESNPCGMYVSFHLSRNPLNL